MTELYIEKMLEKEAIIIKIARNTKKGRLEILKMIRDKHQQLCGLVNETQAARLVFNEIINTYSLLIIM